jgi:hypothetical protein
VVVPPGSTEEALVLNVRSEEITLIYAVSIPSLNISG